MSVAVLQLAQLTEELLEPLGVQLVAAGKSQALKQKEILYFRTNIIIIWHLRELMSVNQKIKLFEKTLCLFHQKIKKEYNGTIFTILFCFSNS